MKNLLNELYNSHSKTSIDKLLKAITELEYSRYIKIFLTLS
jgi:hypothetical protein